MTQKVAIKTSAGMFNAWFSERGLARLEFPTAGNGKKPNAGPWPQTLQKGCRLTQAALENVLAGQAPGELPPLDLSAGTSFQQSVWKALLEIPIGETRTYAELAASVGHPLASRAVGGACGANPIAVLVPCHRALRTGGGLGGFSAGLDWKRRLLKGEGVLAG